MISPNLKETFKELDINDKKNVVSRELILIGEFVKKMKEHYGLESDFDIKNYDVNTETNEDDYLLFIYEDIFEIEKQLISVLSRME